MSATSGELQNNPVKTQPRGPVWTISAPWPTTPQWKRPRLPHPSFE
jgi:hypothetical protein